LYCGIHDGVVACLWQAYFYHVGVEFFGDFCSPHQLFIPFALAGLHVGTPVVHFASFA
jgi:hypothetical protein